MSLFKILKNKVNPIIKLIGFLLILLFLLSNYISAIQAYSFSHCKETNTKTNFKIGFSTLFTGVTLPKPRIIKFPNREYKTIKIVIDKNKYLEGWLLKPKSEYIGTVLIFHGFRYEKSSMLDRAYAFLNLGYQLLLVDFIGARNSYGKQTTIEHYEAVNVKQDYDYIVDKYNEKPIFLCGFSMGAAAIIKAQHDYNLNVKGLILEAPYGKMIDAVKTRVGKLRYIGMSFSYLMTFCGGALNGFNAFAMNPEEYIKNITTPTLLLCGRKDPRIPIEESKRIFENSASDKKEFKIFDDSLHHRYLEEYPDEGIIIVKNFLENSLHN